MTRRLLLLPLLLIGCRHPFPDIAAPPALPSGERWLQHLKQELLPFWMNPAAFGDPPGAFPSVRCDDGSALDRAHPCPEVAGEPWLMEDRLHVVAHSRQIYAYGMAFHLTGDRRYLELARSGLDYLRGHALDRKNGGAYSWRDGSGAWGPEPGKRTPQDQAYSLLGASLYYSLTRDEAVLQDIRAVKAAIFQAAVDPELHVLRRPLVPEKLFLVDTLDQLNAYLVLTTPLLPEPEREATLRDLVRLARGILAVFYSREEPMFYLEVPRRPGDHPDKAKNDFGTTIKALWMIRFCGLIAGDADLVRQAEAEGRRVLDRAWLGDSSTWGERVLPEGGVGKDKIWWVSAELDQFTATLAMRSPELASRLPAAWDYWFRRFVDPAHGEVWTRLDGATNLPEKGSLPKQWPWKAGYHTFEHALVGYVAAQQLHGEPVVLHYAFDPATRPGTVRPYLFEGAIRKVEPLPSGVYRVTFGDVR
ncbi:MAG TPA: AGE family epimerase/isomerase [Myxococcales bacterium]|nr:AGE family epimerase/isomerase [Myxococcales bacterium]